MIFFRNLQAWLRRSQARDARLDGLRGFAIALMVLDHSALVFGASWGVREVLTRAALPLFMLLAGYLWRPGLRCRHLDLVLAAAIATPFLSAIGAADIEILPLLCVCLPLLHLSARWPVLMLSLALVQPSAWPVPWSGYEPGFVLALLIAGQLMRRFSLDTGLLGVGSYLQGFAAVGRWPLTWYVGHLVVLALLIS